MGVAAGIARTTALLHFFCFGSMGGCSAGAFFESLFLELVALLDDLGDPARIPIDHGRIALSFPGAGQAFAGPVARGFAVRRKSYL